MTTGLRAYTANDLESIATLITRIDCEGAQPRRVTAVELDEEFDGVHTDRNRDVIVAVVDDHVVGYGYLTVLLGADTHRCYIWGGIHPDHRGHGLGSEMIDRLIEMASERMADHTDAPVALRAYVPTSDATLEAMFDQRGWTAVRWFDDLHRPVRPVPSVPEPVGITIVDWDPMQTNELRDVKNAAFADHWGSQPSTEHEWSQLTDGGAARLRWSTMALDRSGRIVGLCLVHRHDADDEVLGTTYAWIDKVATLAEHRGQGIAAALISATMQHLNDAGIANVALGVDSDSPTGAHRLYERLGFEPWTRYVTREQWLSHAPG
jgi:mycothiol synthase